MRKILSFAISVGIAALATACVGGSSGGGGTGTGTGNGAGADTASGGSTDTTSGGSGNNTKNTAAVSTKSDSGQSSQVKVDKAASADDTKAASNKNGASNAGKVLNLFIADVGADGNMKVLTVFIDTEKNPLPAAGIAVGKVNDATYVTYQIAGPAGTGSYNSNGSGTIDIDNCPTAGSTAIVGRFHNVVVDTEAAIGGAKSYTLDGPFNLVYFGGAGALTCKAVEPKPDTAGGGTVNVGSLKPPAGSTCNADPCDGGKNTSRNCCPYVPCMEPCMVKCGTDVNACIQGCSSDPMNMEKCALDCYAKVITCNNACLVSCNVSATCKTAAEALNKCEDSAMASCSDGGGDKCVIEKCCSELKAAF